MLIGITGAKGAGKDTFARPLIRRNFIAVKMADTLKDMLRTLYRCAGLDDETIERKIEGDLKEEHCSILQNTPRVAMQTLGTEWRDQCIGNTKLWSGIWEGRVRPLLREGAPIVCTDIRFHHEAEVVRKLGGHLVRVARPGTGEGDLHLSEQEMKSIQVDFSVHNIGSERQLEQKALKILEEITA